MLSGISPKRLFGVAWLLILYFQISSWFPSKFLSKESEEVTHQKSVHLSQLTLQIIWQNSSCLKFILTMTVGDHVGFQINSKICHINLFRKVINLGRCVDFMLYLHAIIIQCSTLTAAEFSFLHLRCCGNNLRMSVINS